MGKRSVVLCSGGVDSTTCLAMAHNEGAEIHALSFDYGQRHRFELEAAARVAREFGAVEHVVVKVDLAAIGGSALTADIAVPKDSAAPAAPTNIPVTYVPARNTIFLALGLARAEVVAAEELWIGINAMDYSGYPDCRPEYLQAFESMSALATRSGVEEGWTLKLRAPLLTLSKVEIIRAGVQHGVDFAWTHSCYDPGSDGRACGRCDACRIREKAFQDLGMRDPVLE